MGGTSAGGGLCLALLLKIRDEGGELPAGAIAISPWTDMTQSGESYVTNAAHGLCHGRSASGVHGYT